MRRRSQVVRLLLVYNVGAKKCEAGYFLTGKFAAELASLGSKIGHPCLPTGRSMLFSTYSAVARLQLWSRTGRVNGIQEIPFYMVERR